MLFNEPTQQPGTQHILDLQKDKAGESQSNSKVWLDAETPRSHPLLREALRCLLILGSTAVSAVILRTVANAVAAFGLSLSTWHLGLTLIAIVPCYIAATSLQRSSKGTRYFLLFIVGILFAFI